jgi:UDP-N-acetylmuramoylalanine--D-glutamate ligase
MIRITTFAGKTVAVFGLARSGIASAETLRAGGANVACWDDGEAGRAAAEKAGLALVDLRTADWSGFAALVLSPGVPLTHPAPHWTVEKAKAAGIEIIGDIELFFRERAAQCPDAPVIAITGTNGKSTTTALIAHVLRSAGRDTQMGGNIGRSILDLEPLQPSRIYVVEMSSFQIDLTPSLTPSVGVLLNISPDHLDRHGTLENYAAVKARLALGAASAIIGIDDAVCSEIAKTTKAGGRVVTTISAATEGDVTFRDGQIFARDVSAPLADLTGVGTLRGTHNGQNAAAAFAALSLAALSRDEIARHMRTYPGLPHRMENVGRLGKVLFINDSKATNADSTERALASFPRDIYWILGGKAKEGGIAPLAPYFPRIAKAYLIGEATETFAATLAGKVHFETSWTLERAVADATNDAKRSGGPEPIVLLSPACASYDQFKSFEQRGDAFCALVTAIPGVAATRPGGT